ncbi:zinc knuckle CX2CX4HX4C containing protein [Tanacetum coccineum]
MADVGVSTMVDSQGDHLHTSSGELNSSLMMNPRCNQDSKGLRSTTDEMIDLINSATSLGEFTQSYASIMNPSSSDTLVHEGNQVRVSTFAERKSQALIDVSTSCGESTSNVLTRNPSSVSSVIEDEFWFMSTKDNVGNSGPVKETITSSGTPYDHIRPTGWSNWNDNASSIGLAGATSLNTTVVNTNSIPVTGIAANFHFVKVDKFESRTGLESVLEGGPWMIKNNPVILKEWKMNTSFLKEELNRVPIWVMFHEVPLEVFDKKGRSSFARCLIEVCSDEPLKEKITIGIPQLEGDDFSKAKIYVEYEWKPPRCDKCKIFGHSLDACPRNIVAATQDVTEDNDGFQKVVRKEFRFQPKFNTSSSTGGGNRGGDEDEEEEVENIYDESANLNLHNTWASTPADSVLDV